MGEMFVVFQLANKLGTDQGVRKARMCCSTIRGFKQSAGSETALLPSGNEIGLRRAGRGREETDLPSTVEIHSPEKGP